MFSLSLYENKVLPNLKVNSNNNSESFAQTYKWLNLFQSVKGPVKPFLYINHVLPKFPESISNQTVANKFTMAFPQHIGVYI